MLVLLLCAQIGAGARPIPPPPVRDHHVRMGAQVHRLWDPASGNQIGLVPFVLAVDIFFHIGDSAVFNVDLRAQSRPSQSETDSPAHRTVVLQGSSPRASGALSFVIPAAPGDWRIIVKEAGRKLESSIDLPLSRIREASLAFSDLVIGARGQGVTWRLAGEEITLAPNQIVSATELIQVYYQVRADTAVAQARTRMTVFRVIANSVQEDEVVSLSFPAEPIPTGISHVQREIDVSHLGGSRYRVMVEVLAPNGERIGTTTGMLELIR